MLSSLRGAAARLMPHGVSPAVAAEVERTLAAESAAASRDDLERITRHALAEVPFYRRLDPGTAFEDLPVMTKPMMVAAPRDVLRRGADPSLLHSRLSSGTSGIRFRAFLDDERMARHRAELVGAYRFLGADPFGDFLYGREWFQVTRTQRLGHTLRGQYLYKAEQDERTVLAAARWLGRRRGAVLVGLSSYLEVLLERFAQLEVRVPHGAVSVVLGVGEPATEHLREMSSRLLGRELRMRYSNTENGLLGFTEPGSRAYKLDTSTFHVEILEPEADVPAAPGALGRVVVTDLHNRAMPFLRYDTGDLGRLAVDETGRVHPNVLAELAGRARDFPLAGTAPRPRRATHFMILEPVEQLEEITQFQLRQHDIGHFTWVLNAQRSAALDRELRRILDEEIGDILSCRVVYEEDALHSGAGKRQTFVSEIPDPDALLARTADGREA